MTRILNLFGIGVEVKPKPLTITPFDDYDIAEFAVHEADLEHEAWASVLKNDFIRLFLGAKVSEDEFRTCYELIGQPHLVVKVEKTEGTFFNITEWQMWSTLQFSEHGILFAPCRRISPSGHILIQERTAPLPEGFTLPHGLPDFFSKSTINDFGSIEGRLVCHNYSRSSFNATRFKLG